MVIVSIPLVVVVGSSLDLLCIQYRLHSRLLLLVVRLMS